jgi:hypothetical protein
MTLFNDPKVDLLDTIGMLDELFETDFIYLND